MKTSTKASISFSFIIILIFVQLAINHRELSNILDKTKQTQDVEAPLQKMTEQVIGYDGILTSEVNTALLHAQKGEYSLIPEHRAVYDTIGSKLDDLLTKDARLLLAQSKRTPAVKDEITGYLDAIDQDNRALVALEARAFAAIDSKDTDTAAGLIVGADYEQNKTDLRQNYTAWSDVEQELSVAARQGVLRDSQMVIYTNLIHAIIIILVLLTALLTTRSFTVERNKSFELLFATSSDALMTLVPPKWNFSAGNIAAFKMFNVKDEKQFDLLTPEDLSPEKQPDGQASSVKAKTMIDLALKEGSAAFDWTHKKNKGADFYATVLLSRVGSGSQAYLEATVRDVTEIKKMETEMAYNNVILRTQQETSLDGILVVGEKGQILSYNQHFVDMWGIPVEVIKSKSDERALKSVMDKLENPEEFLNKVNHLYKFRNEKSRDEIVLKDGRTFDRYSAPMFGTNKQYYGRVWYFRDITERKQTTEALCKSGDKYFSLFQNTDTVNSLYEVVTDKKGKPRDYRYIEVNQAFEKLVGMKNSELVGKTLLKVFPETEKHWLDKLEEAYLTGKPIRFENYSKVLNAVTELNIYTPVKGQLAMTSVDITGRKKMEEKFYGRADKFADKRKE